MSVYSPGTTRTARGRARFLARFASDEERSAYFRELAKLSARRRLVLDAEEASALHVAVDILTRALARLEARDAAT